MQLRAHAPFLLLIFALVLASPAARAAELAGGLIDPAAIPAAQQALAAGQPSTSAAWARLLARSERCLAEEPSPPATYRVPAYYEDAAGHEAAKRMLRDDLNAAWRCALIYRIGFGLSPAQRDRHALQALRLLNAWAAENRALEGGDGRLVMAYVGTAWVGVAELLAEHSRWTSAQRGDFDEWVRNVLLDAANISERTNNWGSWGVFAGLAATRWLGDQAGFEAYVTTLRALIDAQIDPDGRLPLETKRGEKGLWYSYFSLAPLTHASLLSTRAGGRELFFWEPPSGGSLAKALDAFRDDADAARAGSFVAKPVPTHEGWAGSLLFASGHAAGVQRWRDWARLPLGSTNSAWKSADLLFLGPVGTSPVSIGQPGRPYPRTATD